MRALLTKLAAGTMIAGAALAVSACSKDEVVANNTTTEVAPDGGNVEELDNMAATTDLSNEAVDNTVSNVAE